MKQSNHNREKRQICQLIQKTYKWNCPVLNISVGKYGKSSYPDILVHPVYIVENCAWNENQCATRTLKYYLQIKIYKTFDLIYIARFFWDGTLA